MASDLQRSLGALLFFSLILTAFSQGDPTPRDFPSLKELKIEFYQTEVQITIVNVDDQPITAFATEYYDESLGPPRGRVDTLVYGNRMTVLYYNETNEVLKIEASTCEVSDTEDSLLDYEPIFYGWLNKNPLIIGPSAPLWLAENNRDKIRIGNKTQIRDIDCDTFIMDYKTDRDNVTFYYYFAVKEWKTPYKYDNLRVPIRIEVKGLTSADSAEPDEWEEINQITDFAYFRPTVSNWRVFNPPLGIGCPLKKSTKDMPKFPKSYHYSAEVVDLLKAENEEISDIEYQEVWYHYKSQLARLDKFGRLGYTSELYDFNTGVTYSIKNGYKCSIVPLRNSIFEGFDNQVIGHMKEPEEVLGLDEKFYYMGKKLIRGIWADVYESVTEDQSFMKKDVKKLVLTFYYSTEYFEVVVEGNQETRVPIFYTVKGYDVDNDIIINYQYNIFAFDDSIGEEMYSGFNLGQCFPSLNDKSYFLLVMEVGVELAEIMEGQDDLIMAELRTRITKEARVSDLRIPLLRADYTSSGVVVTGLMLDRPPALKQFWLEFTGDASPKDKYLRNAPAANTKEECAFECVGEPSFTCMGFYFCGKDCWIKSKDLLDEQDDVDPVPLGNCEEWLRAERYSTNGEAYLRDALSSLETAVMNDRVNVTVFMNIDDPKKNAQKIVPVSDIIIGDGPYTGIGNQEKPYELMISFAKLNPDDETTEMIDYIDNLNDCFQACKSAEDKYCSSFSYCPSASNKQCAISSVLVIDRAANINDLKDDKNCYVYSMKYLDFYEKYPGRLTLISGDDVVKGVFYAEDCARLCRMETDFNCRGFEYCQKSKTCIMHSKHVLDLSKGQVIETKKKTECIHYSSKYVADYLNMGFTLVDDKSDVRTELTLEECAKICSEEMKDKCKSFNFCPASMPHMGDSTCAISGMTLKTPKVRTAIKKPCEHYEKKDKVDDWAKSKNSVNTGGYTSKGFTGLVVGMLILGFALGAVGFVVYSYFRSKSSGEGMTVRFMKQDNI